MKKERFKTPSAIVIMLKKENKILLQKRKSTGFRDGYYDFSAGGHVEENDTIIETVIKETKEELCIDILEPNIKFMTFVHKKDPLTKEVYYDTYFLVENYEGIPEIGEPEKIEELKWFDIDELPENIIPDRKFAWDNYLNNINFGEFGWK